MREKTQERIIENLILRLYERDKEIERLKKVIKDKDVTPGLFYIDKTKDPDFQRLRQEAEDMRDKNDALILNIKRYQEDLGRELIKVKRYGSFVSSIEKEVHNSKARGKLKSVITKLTDRLRYETCK